MLITWIELVPHDSGDVLQAGKRSLRTRIRTRHIAQGSTEPRELRPLFLHMLDRGSLQWQPGKHELTNGTNNPQIRHLPGL